MVPADVHAQVLARWHEDVVVVRVVPLLVLPSRAHATGVVGIAVGVDLGAVVQPSVPSGVGVDVVRRVHAGAAVVVRGPRLVVWGDHRHVDGVLASAHCVVDADEHVLTGVRVVYRAREFALCARRRRVAG